jgi:hypothetical protein
VKEERIMSVLETIPAPESNVVAQDQPKTKTGVKAVGIASILLGALMIVAGSFTWMTVSNELAQENITVAEDAPYFAGQPVEGPLTAYVEAQVIKDHALAATDGLTYAEMDREDPMRDVAKDASYLRASLFTSVIAFGVSALVVGSGVMFTAIGGALTRLSRP